MESSQIIEHQSLMNGYTRHRFHNSKLAINTVGPDILYYIFKSAVYESSTPVQTVLDISHVCRYWRDTALESPILWRTIDLDSPRSIVDLFVSRSGNTPLIMSWTHPTRDCTECSSCPFWPRLRKAYRECIADPNRIFPRLYSLTFHLRYSELDGFRHVLQNPEVPPLELRRLDIQLLRGAAELPYELPPLPLTYFVRVDPSYLQELILHAVDLPWIELPPNSKLTYFRLSCPPNPPILSHLLKFLSTCPSLCDLQLSLYGVKEDKVDITNSDPIIRSITRLDFPDLKRLILQTMEVMCYIYIREISARIKTVTSLSEFVIGYNNCLDSRVSSVVKDTTTLNIFETIPSGALASFTGHRCLRVGVAVESETFEIFSAPNYPGQPGEGYPFRVSGSFPLDHQTSFDNGLAPILDMVRAMPGITDLGLVDRAWELPWITDIPNLFTCLDTLRLEMRWYHDITPTLNSLPAGLELRRLVVTHALILSVDVLLDVVSKAGVEILELGTGLVREDQIRILETILSERGVEFVRVRDFEEDYDSEEHCDCSDDSDEYLFM